LLVIDVQERLMPVIDQGEAVLGTCEFLASAARQLSIPITASEQYPQGLGPTVESLRQGIETIREKREFSAVPALNWPAAGDLDLERFQVVVVGVETHVCVAQTAMDLVSLGYHVTICVDGVGSRFAIDHETALTRLQGAGVQLATAEAVVFEWLQTSTAPEFRQVSQLVKDRRH
jgi:nicotinamidase-related amidase